MTNIHWYLIFLACVILVASLLMTVLDTQQQPWPDRARYMRKLLGQFGLSMVAYWILVFILSLVIAAAIWLLLLLLIWVPSDFMQNYLGSPLLTHTLHGIKPILFHSATSPGITAIPLLDYVSLYAATVLGPLFGLWSIWKQFHPKQVADLQKPAT